MFDGLKRADCTAKRLPLERIVPRHFQGTIRSAKLLEREEHRCAVVHGFDQCGGFTRGAKRLGGSGGEVDPRVAAGGVDGCDRRTDDIGAAEVDEEQGQAVTILRGDNREIGHLAIGHWQFGAGQSAVGKTGL